ncbi:GNAT family N-acetyltransferase [Dysgonomonas sp. HGC4]|uniref:GNAT family N-acetyltransferase n=1 Tax=Dysgonomonas sp. HGC4 TaxID=1658009 RepID=UPI000680B1D9|nr:GNAT family N-acetyltransferase [Dysgonomonas sp. HGC4]MBD8349139.1 GNAT family N-acetyltransferase [Dysgonomonas sp. HGC4]
MNEPIIKAITLYSEDLFALLLLADPSQNNINEYLYKSLIYGAYINNVLIGVYVLFPVDEQTMEIKNIAVSEDFHKRGIGTLLLHHAKKETVLKGYLQLIIGTANSSISQLSLYQKNGFEIYEIKRDFFIENYNEPIFENGIQAKHMIMLMQKVS